MKDVLIIQNAIDKYREKLREKSGKGVIWGSGGPVDLSVIEEVMKAFDYLEKRVAKLEKAMEKSGAFED